VRGVCWLVLSVGLRVFSVCGLFYCGLLVFVCDDFFVGCVLRDFLLFDLLLFCRVEFGRKVVCLCVCVCVCVCL